MNAYLVNGVIWTQMHRRATPDHLGFIPSFLSENNPKPAKEQFHANYISGWDKFEGFTFDKNLNLLYPGDPPTLLLWEAILHYDREDVPQEVIRVYEHAWVVITQTDGTFEASRLD